MSFLRLLEEEKDHHGEKASLSLQIVYIAIIWVVAIFFGFFPLFCQVCKNSKTLVGLANAFSGGVFVGIALFHLYPEENPNHTLKLYPNTFFLSFMSYLLILFVEKVVFDAHVLIGHVHDDGDSVEQTADQSKNNPKILPSEVNDDENNIEGNEKKEKELEEVKDTETAGKKKKKKQENAQHEDEPLEANSVNVRKPSENEKAPVQTLSLSSAIVLLVALSFHGFFEGVALGIQHSNKGALFLFIAILCHKWAEGFTLGIAFNKALMERCTAITLIVVFSFITPLGSMIGLLLAGTSEIVAGIFLGLSAGTFVYVGASEVIVEEFKKPRNKYWKFFLLTVGGVLMAILKVVEDNEKDH